MSNFKKVKAIPKTNPDFYVHVDNSLIKELNEFRNKNNFTILSKSGITSEYITSGSGEKTILIFHGAMGNAESTYNRILQLQSEYKIIAPSIKGFKSLNQFFIGIDNILKEEKVKTLYVYGGSFGGLMAQSYFYHAFHRIEKLILSFTFPPLPEWFFYFKLMILVLNIVPYSLIFKILSKELLELTKVDVNLTEEQVKRIKFFKCFFTEIFKTKITKKDALCQIKLVLDSMKLNKNPFKDWKGKVLVVTSNTDSNFKYHERLKEQFPNVSDIIYENTGHLGTIIKESEFMISFREFLLSK
jgi:pimeloyl-ACP methyl ester carboxylesterase